MTGCHVIWHFCDLDHVMHHRQAMSKFLRPNYLDASALVKLVVNEEYSARVRDYVLAPAQSWRICTSYCLTEALGVLKGKLHRCELTEKGYIATSRKLIRLLKQNTVRLIEQDFPHRLAFGDAERLVKSHAIDFLDAFQLVSIREPWSYLAPPSKPLLITADRPLYKAAEAEGLLVWFCRETHQPRC